MNQNTMFNVRDIISIRQPTPASEIEEYISKDLDNEIFLCVMNKNGSLGAAYYSFSEKTLNIYDEMVDLTPQYLMTTTLLRELSPKYILTFGAHTEEYTKLLIGLFTSQSDTTTTSNASRIPRNFFLVSLKEFTYETCKRYVSDINIATYMTEEANHKQEVFFRSFVTLNQKLPVQALGALYKYLERHPSIFGLDGSANHFLHMHQVTLKNNVLLDNHTFQSMQIFAQKPHESGLKRGQETSIREGFSIYKLFLGNCKSKLGQAHLRNMLQSPINDQRELKSRLTFIELMQNPNRNDLISEIQRYIKHCKDLSYLSHVLARIYNSRATSTDWQNLHRIIDNTILINDTTKPYRDQSKLLQELNAAITENLLGLHESIMNAIDFDGNNRRTRPAIKFGLDPSLDAKLLHQKDIAKHVTAAAQFALQELPDYIEECRIQYLPEMGHLMAIKEWEPNCDPEQLQYLGHQYMFTIGGIIHYKSPLCIELDNRLGDLNVEIIDHENRILRRLAEFTLKYNKDIRYAVKIVGKIDCLIAIARVSLHNNYVKPELNNERIQEIVNCRHPLLEHILENKFESNSYYSGGPYSHVKIITGANGSGKSIYLKQVLLTIYLTHVGSFVPAEKANVGMVKSIHCRLHTSESASVKLSSFMIDITQTAQAIHYATPSSFIFLDEFGRGTLDDDGLALLASFLNYYLNKKDDCPHIIISTHLQRLAKLIPQDGRYIEYQRMEHTIKDGSLCFLYKLTTGVSNSLAFDVASLIQHEEVIQLAQRCFEFIQGEKVRELPEESAELQNEILTKPLDIPEIYDDDDDDDDSQP